MADVSEVLDVLFEVGGDDFLEAFEEALGFYGAGHVKEDMDAGGGVASEEGFDGGIGVGDRGGVGADDEDDILGEFEEGEDTVV